MAAVGKRAAAKDPAADKDLPTVDDLIGIAPNITREKREGALVSWVRFLQAIPIGVSGRNHKLAGYVNSTERRDVELRLVGPMLHIYYQGLGAEAHLRSHTVVPFSNIVFLYMGDSEDE